MVHLRVVEYGCSLAGHSIEVERDWFRRRLVGEAAFRIYCSEADPGG